MQAPGTLPDRPRLSFFDSLLPRNRGNLAQAPWSGNRRRRVAVDSVPCCLPGTVHGCPATADGFRYAKITLARDAETVAGEGHLVAGL